jgi:hypothetical protein
MASFSRLQPVTIILAIMGAIAVWKNNAALMVCTSIQQQGSVRESVPHHLDMDAKLSAKKVEHVTPFAVNNSTKYMKTTEDALMIHSGSKVNDKLVQQGDFVYLRGDWDGSPVVLEKYKLIFFTSAKVGCTVWKQLFRRIMGEKNWRAEATKKLLPWNPDINGLKYLYDYDRETASHMMTSPEYTRAIFVREPKERLLSAYLDKGVSNPAYVQQKCCPYTGTCSQVAKVSLSNFLDMMQTCEDAHWRPQNRRMEAKYWPYINFVGRMETVADDAKRLLTSVGAWDEFGKSGWGQHGNVSIFGTKAGGAGRKHATHARERLRKYYNTPTLERNVDFYYASDYANPVLNFTEHHLYDSEERAWHQ